MGGERLPYSQPAGARDDAGGGGPAPGRQTLPTEGDEQGAPPSPPQVGGVGAREPRAQSVRDAFGYARTAGAPSADDSSLLSSFYTAAATVVGTSVRPQSRRAATPAQPTRLAAATYLLINANAAWRAVANYLQGVVWPDPAARVTFIAESRFTAMTFDLLHAQVPAFERSPLAALLYPEDPLALVDAMRPADAAVWLPGLGAALGEQFQRSIANAVRRVGARYVEAADVTGTAEVTSDQIASSHPMDRVVARALTSPHMVALAPAASASPGRAVRKSRPVKLTWQGAHDPTLWNWARAEPADATPEEVAAQLRVDYSNGDETTFFAQGLASAPPLFGLPIAWALAVPGARAHAHGISHRAVPSLADDRPEARLAFLATHHDADTLAAQQSARLASPKATAGQVVEAYADCLVQLDDIARALAPYRLDGNVRLTRAVVARKQRELALAPAEALATQATLAFGQRERLVRVSGAVRKVTATGAKVGASASSVLDRALGLYAAAAASSQLATTCEALIADAHTAEADIASRALGAKLVDLENARDHSEAAAHGGAGIARVLRPTDGTLEAGRALQNELINGSPIDAAALERVQVEAGETALRGRLRGLFVQLVELKASAEGAGSGLTAEIASWFSAEFRDLADLTGTIEVELDALEAAWDTAVADDIETDQHATVARRRAALTRAQQSFMAVGARRGLADFFRRGASLVKWQRFRTACVSTAEMLGVSLASAGLGGLVSEGVGTAMMTAEGVQTVEALSFGARTVSQLAGLATETAAESLGTMAQTDESFGRAFLTNALMVGGSRVAFHGVAQEVAAAKQFQRALTRDAEEIGAIERQLATSWSGFGKGVGWTAKESLSVARHTLIGAAVGELSGRVTDAALGTSAQHASAGGAGEYELLLHGASIAIGRRIHEAIGHRMPSFERLAAHQSAKAAHQLLGEAQRVRLLAERAAATGDTEATLEALDARTRLLELERAALDEHETLAPKVGARAHDETAAERTARRAEIDDQLTLGDPDALIDVRLGLVGLEPLVPGAVWRGTPEQVERAVHELRKAGREVIETRDGEPRRTRITIDGRELELHERPAVQEPPQPGAHDAAAEGWVAHIRGQLDPEARARFEVVAAGQSPRAVMDSFGGDFDAARTQLGGKPAPPRPETVDMFAVGELPKFGPARYKFIEERANWKPERAALHDRLLQVAIAQARAFAEQFADATPTLYAMRGNTAAGKTRAVTGNVAELAGPMARTAKLPYRAINPDTFKVDLIAATPGATSADVHSESSMLATRFERAMVDMKMGDGQPATILVDKRLLTVKDVQEYATTALASGRRFVLFDVDAPLEQSLVGVLERQAGGTDPLPPYGIVAEGFRSVRDNRQSVVELFRREKLGSYHLYATSPDGVRSEVAVVENGERLVLNEAMYADATTPPENIADVRIDSGRVNALTECLGDDRAAKVRGTLQKYDGWTWRAALDAHSMETHK